ncbi:hypothetical protein J3E69DRAFT_347386 [Trichoderma sp. SZMC 28015]
MNSPDKDTQNSEHSLTSRLERTQSPATQYSTQYSTMTGFQILNNPMDGKIHNRNSPSPSFEDPPPSTYQTADDGSSSAPASPK